MAPEILRHVQKSFDLIKEVDMDFPAAQHWQQTSSFFPWFPETYIQ